MINENENNTISRFLSLVLRHKPETIGIILDDQGWTDVDILLHKFNEHGHPVTGEILEHVVKTNIKKGLLLMPTIQRFERIRAIQLKLNWVIRRSNLLKSFIMELPSGFSNQS